MTDTRFTAFEQQIETAMQRLAVPGVAYGVVQDGVIYPTVNDWACPWRYQPEDRHPRP
jgi:hypothetical protein